MMAEVGMMVVVLGLPEVAVELEVMVELELPALVGQAVRD
jgi:hypothetical protein